MSTRSAARDRATGRIVAGSAVRNVSGKHLSLEVRGKRFALLLDNHHDNERMAINCKAPPGANTALDAFAPDAVVVSLSPFNS